MGAPIAEVQRTIDITRDLTRYFTRTRIRSAVVTMGGFTKGKHIPASARAEKYERIGEALKRLDASGVRLAAQTSPPYLIDGWSSAVHNLFLGSEGHRRVLACVRHRALCLDISHTILACNF